MSSASYRLAPLDATHDRTFFNSDLESLNRYSRGKSFKTFVVVSPPASWRWPKGSALRVTTH